MHTACVFVVGKNYRLQNIQLSKITPGDIAPRNSFGGARGDFPRTPLAHSLAGPQSPAPFVRLYFLRFPRTRRDVGISLLFASRSRLGFGELRGLNGLASNKVENTGLEPVTSWLQTRRSPS